MSESNYDLVIIGGGMGGYVAGIRGAQLGMRVAIVERGSVGGTCLHRGCIPTKALLRSAEVFHTVQNAAAFGTVVEQSNFELTLAMARKSSIVEQLHKGVQFLLKKYRIDVITGTGRVMGPSIFSPQAGAVSVQGKDGESRILHPRFTLIATGSRPKPIPGLPFDGTVILSSDHALELTELPKSTLIIGAGAIGVEWASMLNDFGVQVTLVEALPRILPQEDEEVSKELARVFRKRGIRVLTGAKVLPDTLVKESTGAALDIEMETGRETVHSTTVLVAIGREPLTHDLGLEATEIVVEQGAIVVDEHYRTQEPTIFAVGDVIGGMQLAHVAAHEGIHAVEAMADLSPRPIDYHTIPVCTYARPEVASIGCTESAAKGKGRRVKSGMFAFRANGKALVFGETDGFVKVVADADTDDVLGVHIIGPHATDMISEAAVARFLNATPWEVGHTIHPHPTLSEVLGEAALAVDGIAIHA